MFIIVGNDTLNEQVSIYDTKDCTINKVSYNTLDKALKQGIKVEGVSQGGNIICKTPNVLQEIIVQIQPIIAKALLLNLQNNKVCEMLLPIFNSYYLADTADDLGADLEKNRVAIKNIGGIIDLKSSKSIIYSSIRLDEDFKKLGFIEQYMLKELAEIPCISPGLRQVDAIFWDGGYRYYIEIPPVIRYVSLKEYTPELTIKELKSKITFTTPYFYSHYLDKLYRNKENTKLYYIDELRIVRARSKEAFAIYKRTNKGV